LLELAIAVLQARELIVVSVGTPGPTISNPRRAFDFYPVEDFYPGDIRGSLIRQRDAVRFAEEPLKGGGADAFLDFIVDDVRPRLAGEYRMAPDDHGIVGFSAGGWFVLYALFKRPTSFKRFIAGTPAVSFCDGMLFDMEERFASEHDDLSAAVFFGIGENELTVDYLLGCFSSTARMVELLSFREYPSLKMSVEVFPGETHATVAPIVVSAGVRFVWGDATLLPGAPD
jgi:predicted alpha/beta superfamily hydrolase